MTELPLGPLGYGAAAIGNLYQAFDDEGARATLEAAWNGGVRYFDTAPHYGTGLSETRLGAFLATKPRNEYILSTKVGRLLVPNPRYRPGDKDPEGFDVEAATTRRWDFSEAGLRQSLEESLQRLRLDSIDILYLHDPDVYDLEAGREEALPALQRMKADGLCRAIGVGSNSAEALADLVDAAELDLVMLAGRYTLLEQSTAQRLLPLCVERNVGIVTAAVFNSGILADSRVPDDAHYNYRKAPVELLDKARRLSAVCGRHGVALPAAALQYTLQHPAVRNVVIGARGAAQITSNVANMHAPVPDELWTDLQSEGLIP